MSIFGLNKNSRLGIILQIPEDLGYIFQKMYLPTMPTNINNGGKNGIVCLSQNAQPNEYINLNNSELEELIIFINTKDSRIR